MTVNGRWSVSVSQSAAHHSSSSDWIKTINRNLVFSSIIIVFATSFSFGWNVSVINQPYIYIIQWFNDTYTDRSPDGQSPTKIAITALWSATNALFVVGLMIGGIIGGFCADSLGRKGTIMMSQIIGTILSTAAKDAKSPEMLIIGRMLIGITCGVGNCIAPAFLAEISPTNLRGAFCSLHELLITFGGLVASVLGLPQVLCSDNLWPYLNMINVLAIVAALAILPLVPETPRYIMMRHNDEYVAKKSLIFYRRSADVDQELAEMASENESAKLISKQQPFTVKEMFSKKYRRPFSIAMVLQVAQQFSGISVVFFYSASLFEKAGVSPDSIPFAVLGMSIVNFVATIAALPLVEVAGRRKLLIIPTVLLIGDLVLLTVMMAVQNRYEWANYVSIACVIVDVVLFEIGLGPIPWLIGAELFGQSQRAKVMSSCAILNSICTLVIVMCFSPIEEIIGCYVFIIFIVILVVMLTFIILTVPETRNKTFDEIAREMKVEVDNGGS